MGHWSTTPDMGTVLHTWLNGSFVQIQDGIRSNETPGLIKGAHFPRSSLDNGLDIWLPVHRSSKGKLVSGNSMHTGTKRGSLWQLKGILHRSNTSSPADSICSKHQTYQDWNREWCHLCRSLFLIELHQEDH